MITGDVKVSQQKSLKDVVDIWRFQTVGLRKEKVR